MSNYFNSLPHRLKVQELGKCDLMLSNEFSDGVNYLIGKKIVIIGCGAQGLVQGQNMRDSGLTVAYALRKEAIESNRASYQNDVANGFEVGTFEEINLRFYVQRKEDGITKRGVVFINETIPYRIVAWMANKLYKEHYTVVPTKHFIHQKGEKQQVKFEWLLDKKWNHIFVESGTLSKEMFAGSLEEFIYEHYYGYTMISDNTTEEYRLQHPSWHMQEVINYDICCDFSAMYGDAFSVLNESKPTAVFLAKGSSVKVYWKRTRLKVEDERS